MQFNKVQHYKGPGKPAVHNVTGASVVSPVSGRQTAPDLDK